MVRQSGEPVIHYDCGDGPLCGRATVGTSDPLAVSCGLCMKRPVWRQAWREARKAVAR